MTMQPPRNFTGYGPNPHAIRWPHRARIAISVVVNYDEGSVETFQSGRMGFLGYADADGAVAYYRYPERRHTADSEFEIDHRIDELPQVDIAYAYAGVSGVSVDALAASGARGHQRPRVIELW